MNEFKNPDGSITKSSALPPGVRYTAGLVLAGILGVVFVVLGTVIALASGRGDAASLAWQHLFGVRDAFLGGFVLLLLGTRRHDALFVFMVATVLLPLADTVVTAGLVGASVAARGNLPYEVPLLLCVWLLWRK